MRVLAAVFLSVTVSACNVDGQIEPLITGVDGNGDSQVGANPCINRAAGQLLSSLNCIQRSFFFSRKENKISQFAAELNATDAQTRNSVQTLLLMHADEICNQYQYQLYSTGTVYRLGEAAIDSALSILATLLTRSTAKEIIAIITTSFGNTKSVLNDRFMNTIFMVDKLREVHKSKLKMKQYIISAQQFPAKGVAKGNIEGSKISYNGVYTMTNAIYDASLYHRVCDISDVIINNPNLAESYKGLFAYRFGTSDCLAKKGPKIEFVMDSE